MDLAAGEKIRVLLVDDEADFRGPLAKRLARRDFCVGQAGDGSTALAALEAAPADVVVLDVRMPGWDGLAVLCEIKARHPDAEVILLTGHVSAREGVAGISAGAFDYLTKPVNLDHLTGKIRLAYEKAKQAKERTREAELRAEKDQQAFTKEKLTELGALAQGAALEMTEPLVRISQAAALLKGCLNEREPLPYHLRANMEDALRRIEDAVLMARGVASRLLAFSRGDDSLIKEFDLLEVMRDVVELTRKTASKNQASVSFVAPPGPLFLKSDPYKLRQVLKSLVQARLTSLNGSEGGLKLLVEADPRRATIKIKNQETGEKRLNRDDAPEPRLNLKPSGRGTGLSLFAAKVVIEKLGGRVEAEAAPPGEAWVKITLPRFAAARTEPEG
ncbi:MAG: response regulator [Pseudomonadota bacterium]